MRSKGELNDGLRRLEFERLSLFNPSVIQKPTNHYELSQAVLLTVWPKLQILLQGKYRGIDVVKLDQAIAKKLRTTSSGLEESLYWDDFL